MFTSPKHVTCHMSRVTCHVSRVTCHMSRVTCHFFSLFFRTKWWSLSVEGLLSTGPTPSSSFIHSFIHLLIDSVIPFLQIFNIKFQTNWHFERMFTPHHVSHVTFYVSHATFFLLSQIGEASGWRVCYHRVLPRLVCHHICEHCTTLHSSVLYFWYT